MNCTSLESLVIPDGIVSIGKKVGDGPYFGTGTFVYCRNLKYLTIPNSVKSFMGFAEVTFRSESHRGTESPVR